MYLSSVFPKWECDQAGLIHKEERCVHGVPSLMYTGAEIIAPVSLWGWGTENIGVAPITGWA
jgi:hypothetical protein